MQIENEKQLISSPIAFLSPEESAERRMPFDDESLSLPLPPPRPQPLRSDPFLSPSLDASSYALEESQPVEAIPLRHPLCEYTQPKEEKFEIKGVDIRVFKWPVRIYLCLARKPLDLQSSGFLAKQR